MKNTAPSYLKHQFLMAMPHMADPNFAQKLIYVVEHGPEGAMGLVVNDPSGLNLADVLEQLRPDEPCPIICQSLPVFAGGPVQTDRGFVLHPGSHSYQATLALGELAMTTSQDVLFAIADGHGPQHYLVALATPAGMPASSKRSWPTIPGSAVRFGTTSSSSCRTNSA